MSIAYALRAEYRDTYAGGVLCVGPNGESLDTLEALQAGDGVIVVNDTDTYSATALDAAPAFKRVAVPDEAPEPVDRFESLTVAQLRDEAQRLGVESPGRSRDEVLSAVRAAANPDTQEA